MAGTGVGRKRKEPKSLREDPQVQEMTTLLNAGRAAERMDIIEELEGRLNGTRGWWAASGALFPDETRAALEEFKRWVESRG